MFLYGPVINMDALLKKSLLPFLAREEVGVESTTCAQHASFCAQHASSHSSIGTSVDEAPSSASQGKPCVNLKILALARYGSLIFFFF